MANTKMRGECRSFHPDASNNNAIWDLLIALSISTTSEVVARSFLRRIGIGLKNNNLENDNMTPTGTR